MHWWLAGEHGTRDCTEPSDARHAIKLQVRDGRAEHAGWQLRIDCGLRVCHADATVMSGWG